MKYMVRTVAAIAAWFLAIGYASASDADIDVRIRLDKQRYLAGEPAYLMWEYTNKGTVLTKLLVKDPYCWASDIVAAASLPRSLPPTCPDPGEEIFCRTPIRQLGPGEAYAMKYLLNSRFNLNQPGTYELTVSEAFEDRRSQARTLSLVVQPSSELDLRKAYAPYLAALQSGADTEAVRALAGSGMTFAESELLRASMDPRTYYQPIANDGLARLRTPLACARLAELSDQYSQRAMEYLGQCGDPSYMQFLFALADRAERANPNSSTPRFALLAAAEAGGDAAVERLKSMLRVVQIKQDDVYYALGRTGSKQAVQAIVDALLSLFVESEQNAALRALTTLTHRESKRDSYRAKAGEWREWWATGKRDVYKPRDCRGGITDIANDSH